MKAMLLTEVGLSEVERYLTQPEWTVEQKHDGTRALVALTTQGMWVAQRDGSPLKHTAATQWLRTIQLGCADLMDDLVSSDKVVLDGEVMIRNGEFRVFDLPMMHLSGRASVTFNDPFRVRRRHLDMIGTEYLTGKVEVVRNVSGVPAKQEMYESCRSGGVEGVVFKHDEGKYLPGLRTEYALKVKFVKSADLVIIGRSQSPNSATLGAFDRIGRMRQVGSTSMIGKPGKVGDVVEVNFLYWTGTHLYQPRIVRVRHDKTPEECLTAQFKAYSRETV